MEVDQQDVWWYICTLCNQAFRDEAGSRAHKRKEHLGVAARGPCVLILSQEDQLSPTIAITRCSSSSATSSSSKGSRKKVADHPMQPVMMLDLPDKRLQHTRWSVKQENDQLAAHDEDKAGLDQLHDTTDKDKEVEEEEEDLDLLMECDSPMVTRSDSDGDEDYGNEDEDDSESEPSSEEEDEEDRAPKLKQKKEKGGAAAPTCSVCLKSFSNSLKLKHHTKYHVKTKHLKLLKKGKPCDCTTCYKEEFLVPADPSPSTIGSSIFLWQCKLCQKSVTEYGITQHMRRSHPGCVPSGLGDKAPESAWREARLAHPDFSNPPPIPKKEKHKRKNEDRVKRSYHYIKPASYKCSVCPETFSTYTRRLYHVNKMHQSMEDRTCPTCGKVCATAKCLSGHQKRMHFTVSKDFLCTTCGSSFKTNAELKNHAHRHDPANKTFICQLCPEGRTFFNKPALARHHSLHHEEERKHQCPECGKLFKLADHLTRHRNDVHLGIRAHKCAECGAAFRRQHHLRDHVTRNHTAALPTFACSHPGCTRTYKTEGDLKRHVYFGHGEEKHPCDRCDKKFTTKASLDVHKVSHSELRTYHCEACDKKFKLKSQLYQHSFSHLPYEDLPHVCDHQGCGKRFGWPGHLRAHKQRIHGY